MAEDQGVNGDIWNDEASRLLERIGWIKVADSNIDVPGSSGLSHGIDSIFKYEDGFKPNVDQGVFIEAKRYKTSSFSASKLRDWITRIDFKIRELDNSAEFYDRYPMMEGLSNSNGLLMLWFPDTINFPSFRAKFREALLSVKTPRTRGVNKINRLFVLENDNILRLASLMDSVEKWDIRNRSELADTRLYFHYPSSHLFGYPIQDKRILSLEYVFSKFVLAKAKEVVDGTIRDVDIVFYFGKLNMHSFYRLREALLAFDMLSVQNSFYLYNYQRSDEFRKIEPEVLKLFKFEGPHKVVVRSMTRPAELPDWIKDQE